MATTNEGLVQELIEDGSITSPKIIATFKEVDRKIFLPVFLQSKVKVYANTPLRESCPNGGFYHQSQPLIYGRILERLMPLTTGMSFLNIGSGTGYFSTLVSFFLGADGTNHGIELYRDNVTNALDARQRFFDKTSKFSNVNYVCGNAYNLDMSRNIKYDRVYVSQEISDDDIKFFMLAVKPDGFMVAPVGNELHCVSFKGGDPAQGLKTEKFPFGVRFAKLVAPIKSEIARFVLEEVKELQARTEASTSSSSSVAISRGPSVRRGASVKASTPSEEIGFQAPNVTENISSISGNKRVMNVMISFNTGTSARTAASLKKYLQEHDVGDVWICTENLSSGSNYRKEINQVAASCKVFLPIINMEWLQSAECDSEANIAISYSNKNKRENPAIAALMLPLVDKKVKKIDLIQSEYAAAGTAIHFMNNTNVAFFGDGNQPGTLEDAEQQFATIGREVCIHLGKATALSRLPAASSQPPVNPRNPVPLPEAPKRVPSVKNMSCHDLAAHIEQWGFPQCALKFKECQIDLDFAKVLPPDLWEELEPNKFFRGNLKMKIDKL